MRIIAALLQSYLDKQSFTVTDFAREAEISVLEAERLLDGGAVDKTAARKFIYFFGADEAQTFIDWVTMGISNPLAN